MPVRFYSMRVGSSCNVAEPKAVVCWSRNRLSRFVYVSAVRVAVAGGRGADVRSGFRCCENSIMLKAGFDRVASQIGGVGGLCHDGDVRFAMPGDC